MTVKVYKIRKQSLSLKGWFLFAMCVTLYKMSNLKFFKSIPSVNPILLLNFFSELQFYETLCKASKMIGNGQVIDRRLFFNIYLRYGPFILKRKKKDGPFRLEILVHRNSSNLISNIFKKLIESINIYRRCTYSKILLTVLG